MTEPDPAALVGSLVPMLSDLGLIALVLLGAWLARRLSRPIARRLLRVGPWASSSFSRRPERLATLHGLVADIIGVAAIVVVAVIVLRRLLDVNTDTIVWTVGLFSAAFGFGARPLISDVLAGMSFIFEDAFAVGEKIGLVAGDPHHPIEGVVEAVRLRTTLIRAPTGELCIVPNGEVRALRNYTRGRFSAANVTLRVRGGDLAQALAVLEELGREAADTLPNLLEPWQIISTSGVIGQETELTLVAKARFGTGAELRPQLLALVQARLGEAGVLG